MRKKVPTTLYIRSPRLNQLLILNEIASDPNLRQAELARRCELSVAMVNNYMKQLCATGLLEYHRKSSKTVSYHLTDAGREQLEVIQQELQKEMVDFFVRSKSRFRELIVGQAMLHRVILFGNGDLAQLVYHSLQSADINVIGVCDDDPQKIGLQWCGREILDPSQIRHLAPDAVIIVDCSRTDEIYSGLQYLAETGIRVIRLDGPPVEHLLSSVRIAPRDSAGSNAQELGRPPIDTRH